MSRTLVFFAAVTALLLASSSQADEELAREWIKFFEGNWTATGTAQVGNDEEERFEVKLRGRLLGDGMAVAMESVEGESNAVVITYWEPEREVLVSKVIRDWSFWTVVYSRIEDNVIKGTIRGTFDDPQGDGITAGTTAIHKTKAGYRLVLSTASPERPSLVIKAEYERQK